MAQGMIKQPKDYWESERVDTISKLDDIKAIKEELRNHKKMVLTRNIAIAILVLHLLVIYSIYM
jgi:hypothetical protein